jgi:Transposase DDE domain
MESARKRRKARKRASSLLDCLRKFATPAVWKQAQQARKTTRRPVRWRTQPLLLVLLTMTWCCGDSLGERFETARAFCVVCQPRRKRPGRTIEGFQKALGRLPRSVLRAFAAGVRRHISHVFADRLPVEGFIPLGCDGSRLECPRTAELEQRLGAAGCEGSAPNLWVTALVHLPTGLLWSWRLGKGTASERDHLRLLLSTLPGNALVICDAGYKGFELASAILAGGAHFLIRASSQLHLFVEEGVPVDGFREGVVYYWPNAVRKAHEKPLKLRLLCVKSEKTKHDVWLLTSVLDVAQLPLATAARFYRWRWENEGFFRTYKRTLHKVKLVCRTVRTVHREAEGSLLAVQLLLAQGALAMPAPTAQQPVAVPCSPRQVLREIRRQITGLAGRAGKDRFGERLSQARRERRLRTSSKVKRPWPRRCDHKAPKPPLLRTLSEQQKALIARYFNAS